MLPRSGIRRAFTKTIQPHSTSTNQPTTGQAKTIDKTNIGDSTRIKNFIIQKLFMNSIFSRPFGKNTDPYPQESTKNGKSLQPNTSLKDLQ